MPYKNASLKPFNIVFIAAEVEYQSQHTLAMIAKEAGRQGADKALNVPAPSNNFDLNQRTFYVNLEILLGRNGGNFVNY